MFISWSLKWCVHCSDASFICLFTRLVYIRLWWRNSSFRWRRRPILNIELTLIARNYSKVVKISSFLIVQSDALRAAKSNHYWTNKHAGLSSEYNYVSPSIQWMLLTHCRPSANCGANPGIPLSQYYWNRSSTYDAEMTQPSVFIPLCKRVAPEERKEPDTFGQGPEQKNMINIEIEDQHTRLDFGFPLLRYLISSLS